MISPQSPKSSAGSQEKRAVILVCIGLAAMVLVVFGQSLRNGFVDLDDGVYVYANDYVPSGFTWTGIKWAFTNCQPAGIWHPLTWLSLMLDSQVYGLNPCGFHFTNALLHAAATVLLFLALNQMTGTLWRSAFAAAIFAVHPLRVESVAWVAERKDVLSGLFFMLTLLMYARYVRVGARRWSRPYILMVVFTLLGLLAKPMLITLPFVLLLLDYWPLQRFTFQSPFIVFRRLLIEKLPLFVLAAAASVLAFFAQKVSGAMLPEPFGLRLENAVVSHGLYLMKMFWPEHLAVFYPFPTIIPWWKVVMGAILLLGGTLAVILMRRRFPWLLFGWFWHLGMLVPVIGIIHFGGQALADRYSYLPQIGLYVALAWGINDLAIAWRIPRIALGTGAGIIITVLAACSINQISYWRNSKSLWTHNMACTPSNSVAQLNLGKALEADGQRSEAIEHYRQALQLVPNNPIVLYYLGMALVEQGQLNEAVDCFTKVTRILPNDASAYDILGTALAKEGKAVEAIDAYRKALELQPDNPEVCFHLAELLASQKQFTEAIQDYELALRWRPDYPEAQNALADALAAQSQFEEAIGHYQAAIQSKPDYVMAHYNLGVLLAAHARLDEAAEQFRTVIQLDPDYTNAYGNLANVLMGQGKLDEAIIQYQQTVELAPGSAQAHFRLGLALEKKGQMADAIEQFKSTLRLNPNHEGAKIQLRTLGASPL
jgi:tetratricopeptide (TPR) repeat protein